MTLRTFPATLAFLVIAALPSVHAQSITRGPYLQMLSPNAITVRWQTDVATDSRVQYGGAPDTLASNAGDGASVIEHDIRLTGLTPDTTYHYSVGTSATMLAGGDDTFRFKTAPLPGTIQPVRIWVLGDSGTGGDGTGRAESVRDGYYNSTFYQDPDFWMMLGDNAYTNGTEAETTRAIFQTHPMMLRKCTLWSTLGNHDTYTSRGEPYFNAFNLPENAECGGQASGTERYYSFDYANIHFICLDSEGNHADGSPQLEWAKRDLENTIQQWIIAFWHAPPYSRGSHNTDTEPGLVQQRLDFLPLLESHGVDLVLCGHSHCYERSMLLNGHYGLSSTFDPNTMALDTGDGSETGDGAYQKTEGSNNGTVYVVGGNSGKASGGSLDHPVMITSQNKLGSLIIDVNNSRLDVHEIGTDGVPLDNFTLLKGPLGPRLIPMGWYSVSDHAGTPRALPILDHTFIEPRQAGLRRVEISFFESVLVGNPATAVAVTGINAAGPVDLSSLGITVTASAIDDRVVVEFSNDSGPCALPDAAKWRFTLNPAALSGTSGAILPNGAANSRVITSLAGDTTGTGRCTGIDLNRIANSGPFNPLDADHLRADITGDGVIDATDRAAAWANRATRTDTLTQPD